MDAFLTIKGALLLFCFDYSGNPEAWHNSMRLLARSDAKGRSPDAGAELMVAAGAPL
jgi:hypothetical protein